MTERDTVSTTEISDFLNSLSPEQMALAPALISLLTKASQLPTKQIELQAQRVESELQQPLLNPDNAFLLLSGKPFWFSLIKADGHKNILIRAIKEEAKKYKKIDEQFKRFNHVGDLVGIDAYTLFVYLDYLVSKYSGFGPVAKDLVSATLKELAFLPDQPLASASAIEKFKSQIIGLDKQDIFTLEHVETLEKLDVLHTVHPNRSTIHFLDLQKIAAKTPQELYEFLNFGTLEISALASLISKKAGLEKPI